MIGGSMTDPDKQYFLEINMKNHEVLAKRISKLMREFENINAKIYTRRSDNILYIKKYDDILRLLSAIGCQNIILDLENRSVIKQIKSGVNRGVNCEMRNLEKKIRTSKKQITLFEKVKEKGIISLLDDKSVSVLNARLDNPDMSLSEIAEITGMTKSQVNYYIKKIERKYLKYTTNLVHS
jgi:hypothetical protein